ncbi:nucleoside triphosphate pyrophosphohydrolase [Defluviitalea saccharophila]|uniref:Nucleoside triphosphate pyrophosphohydrolase n=1 Tax=Defluviitalea saccharophila TaxID=879970 RepID=A0ABZ2Y1R0_9FIRM|nr:nucleoside triphosphate pyrophosphohydrolase [Candidatus Epulonipiscium sp.]
MVKKEKYTYEDLLVIMRTLRGENGCAWDLKQTHESLLPNLLEESYEVIDAIKKGDQESLKEELGDLLLQIVFHSRIAEENKEFTIDDVIDGICKKLILRHPHIFGDTTVESTEEILQNWEQIKKKEKGFESQTEVLKSVPEVLPALVRAYKVQAKAAHVGFDWTDIKDALDKVNEEFEEFREAHKSGNNEHIMEEYGDLLFSIVNIARFLKINPEFALTNTIEKFINRFEYVENTAISRDRRLEDMTLEEMDKLWEESKLKVSKIE